MINLKDTVFADHESSAGIGFAACAGKHYFVIGTKALAAFLAYPC